MNPMFILLAMQAAGMITDYVGKHEQVRMARLGAKIEQAGINANLYNARLASEQESLDSMKALRRNLGTQAAMLAARGIRAGAGSALLSMQESLGNFNADERMRKLNLLSTETELKAHMTLSKLHQKSYASKTMNEFTTSSLNRFPSTPEGWRQYMKGFNNNTSSGGKTGSFGMTSV